MSQFVLSKPQQFQPIEISGNASVNVGIFDSGVGGLTVLRELLARRPGLNVVYFADSLNLPYGGRGPEQLLRFAQGSIEFLLSKGANLLAVGCNTTMSVMGQGDLKSYGLPVFDLVSSTVDWLRVQHGRPQRLGLLGTVATVQSRYWERKLAGAFPEMQVTALACPEFVQLVEDPHAPEAAIRHAVRERLGPLLDSGIRTLLHACTHYPWLQRYMTELEPELMFIDPAQCLAERLCASLPQPDPSGKPGKLQLYCSRPTELFYRFASEALGREARELTRMYIVNPYED